MNEVEFTAPLTCAACGHVGMRVKVSREGGEGAEVLAVCERCGGEQWDEMSEAQARALDSRAAEPGDH